MQTDKAQEFRGHLGERSGRDLMSIEELGKKFLNLAKKPMLSKSDHEEIRKLMQQLKNAGMSNEEISKLSNGKWTPSTVKGYTKGIKAGEPNPWHDTVSLLDDLISANMTLGDVETTVSVCKNLKQHDINLDDMIHLLLAVDSASMDPASLVQLCQELKECGLLPKNVAEVLALKKDLEDKGLGLDSLTHLLELIEKYGSAQEIIQAVSDYASLTELQQQISKTNAESASLNEEIACRQQQLEDIEAELLQKSKPLEAYGKVTQLGFGEVELAALCSLTGKYGGLEGILKAVEAYNNYSDILSKTGKAETALSAIQANISKLETQYAHLKSATAMCDSLIRQYNFGLDAITTVFSVATKYGEPICVLKAAEVYGELQALEAELAKLEGKVAQRKTLLGQLEGEYCELLSQLESLYAVALKVGAEVGKVESKLADSKGVQKLVNLVSDPASAGYNEYGPLVLTTATALRKWLITNEQRFKFPHNIKKGLEDLIAELGGK
jgi:hypothetical protein